ncbi:MAG: DUF7507 domain-containing protein [Actinomycetota bacterium]
MASQHARRPLHRWAGPAHRASGLERAVVRNYLRIALALLLALLVLPGSGGSATAEDAGTTGGDSSLSTEVVDDSAAGPADDSDTGETPEPTEPAGPADEGRMSVSSSLKPVVLKVSAGGTRVSADTVSDLAGVQLRLWSGDSSGPGAAIGETWASCTSDGSGLCTFTVPGDEAAAATDGRFWVVQDAAPAGWYANPQLVTGGNTTHSPLAVRGYRFRTGELRPGSTYTTWDTTVDHFMWAPDNGSHSQARSASNGRWQNSLGNPALQQSCQAGLDVALVLDLSGSVSDAGAVDDLRQAAKGFVDGLHGTGSAVALYTFAGEAPRNTGPSGANYDLMEIDAGTNLATIKSRIDGYQADGGTNWDRGLWQVAADATAYDLAIVVTDGNPTYYGGPPSKGPGSFTSFKEMEEAIFSANAIKAEGTRVLAVGVGDGVSGDPANLRAVSGTTAYAPGVAARDADYFQSSWAELQALLGEIADGVSCKATVAIEKRQVETSGAAPGTAAAGWEFTATRSAGDGTIVPGDALTTGVDGRTAFDVEFTSPTDDAATVSVAETPQAGWTLDRVLCSVNGGPAGAAALSGDTFELGGLGLGDSVECTVYNVKEVPAPNPPAITVTKTASVDSVDEPGEDVTYTVVVSNDGDREVTLTSLDDDRFGDRAKGGDLLAWGAAGNTCDAVASTIPVGGSVSCEFVGHVTGTAGDDHVNVVTAVARAANGDQATDSDDAVVAIKDLKPSIAVDKTAGSATVGEPGGKVTYTVTVTNESPEPVTLVELADDRFGDRAKGGDLLEWDDPDNTCGVLKDVEILVGGSVGCTFAGKVTGDVGDTHTNTVSAVAQDDDGNQAEASDTAVVTVVDTPPTVKVTKTADKASVPEPGAAVTYTVTVENTSAEEITLTALADDKFGDLLDGDNDAIEATSCQPGQSLAADETYTCTFTAMLTGLDAGDTHDNTVTATVTDDDGTTATGEDDETVEVTDVLPTIEVTKTAPSTIREPGGPVTYAVSVENKSVEPVTLRTLVDDKFGDLLDDAGNDKVSDSTCVDDTVIGVGEAYTCTFTGQVTGDAGFTHTNVVTATAEDDEKNAATDDDDATVTVSDVAPIIDVTKDADRTSVPETGAAVTYTVGVKNLSAEPVTLVSLLDDRFGDLLDDAGNGAIRSSTCVDGTAIAVGATYTCTFVATVGGGTGSSHVNVVTAVAVDNDGSRASDFDTATVRVTDVPPAIELTKDAAVDSVAETGELVTFTVAIRNTGVETVTITKLVDDVYGDLLDPANDSVESSTCAKATIAAGTTYTCTFQATVTGKPGEDHRNVITGTVRDDDGTTVTDEDDETITITDVVPTIEVTKTADVDAVDAPGGEVTYTVTVENTSAEAVTLTELVDDRFGDLLDAGNALVAGTCADDEPIAAGATYTCTFTATVAGSGGFHVNVVTATVVDDDGTEAVGDDEESVVINEVLGEEEERPEGERPDGERPEATRPEALRPGAGLGILPDTGAGRMAVQVGMLGALMLLVGGGILVSRRRRES